MLKRVCGENVAVHILKVIFFGKKWRNSKIWGEIFVNLQTNNKNNKHFDEKTGEYIEENE